MVVMVTASISEKMTFEQYLKGVWEQAMWISGEKHSRQKEQAPKCSGRRTPRVYNSQEATTQEEGKRRVVGYEDREVIGPDGVVL